MKINNRTLNTIDVSVLPKNAQQELYDFYTFLITKYNKRNHIKRTDNKAEFMKEVAGLRFHMPNDYSFDRNIANER